MSGGGSTPPRGNGDGNGNGSHNNKSGLHTGAPLSAALKGATLAFQAQKSDIDKAIIGPTPMVPRSPNPALRSPQPGTDNGALRAATRASSATMRSRSPSVVPTGGGGRLRMPKHDTGPSSTGGEDGMGMASGSERRSLDMYAALHKPLQYLESSPAGTNRSSAHLSPDPKSASMIAAALAASSRTSSPGPNLGQSFSLSQTQLHSRIQKRPSLDERSIGTVSSSSASLEQQETKHALGLISHVERESEDAASDRTFGVMTGLRKKTGLPAMRLSTPERPLSPRLSPDAAMVSREGTTEHLASVKSAELKLGKTSPHIPAESTETTTLASSSLSPRFVSEAVRRSVSQAFERGAPPSGTDRSPNASTVSLHCNNTTSQEKAPQGATKTVIKPPPPSRPKPRLEAPIRGGGIQSDSPNINPRNLVADTLQLQHAQAKPKPYHSATFCDKNEPARVEDGNKGIIQVQRIKSATASDRPVSAQSGTSSNDTFVSASSVVSPQSPSPIREREHSAPESQRHRPLSLRRVSTANSLHHRSSLVSANSPASPALSSRQPTAPSTPKSLALDSLTNAIMAGNLASARHSPAPSRQPSLAPVPPPSRRHHHHSHILPMPSLVNSLRPNHTGGDLITNSGTATPTTRSGGVLRQTLRAPATHSDDEDARNHRKKLRGTKKHAHHEGSRRRWRDEVTPRERRRYEAVWASNRGLLLRPGFAFQHPDHYRSNGLDPADVLNLSRALDGPEAERVANVVVRDIWSRSRLPIDELAEVWDLVDREGCGALSRDEFVVGMWLIDQRLRGRKIPARVSESVWQSAGGGMRLLTPKPKGKGKVRH